MTQRCCVCEQMFDWTPAGFVQINPRMPRLPVCSESCKRNQSRGRRNWEFRKVESRGDKRT